MSGQIKAGRGTLIGNAGEYYVVAELLKRSVIAAMTPRNSPGFDVLAIKDGETVGIRVKTKSEAYDIWQWSAKKDGTIFPGLTPRRDFTVLVGLAEARGDMLFYVVPTHVLDKWLREDHEQWLRTPGKKGQKHRDNPKRHLPLSNFGKALEPYREAWTKPWEDESV